MSRLLACAVATTFAGLALSAQGIPPHSGSFLTTARPSPPSTPPNKHPHVGQRDAGWKLLFDGTTTNGWRGFKKTGFPTQGLVDRVRPIEARLQRRPADPRQRRHHHRRHVQRLRSALRMDRRAGWQQRREHLVTEDRDEPIAHEYQIIDDAKHPDALIGPHRATAALYDVIAAPAAKILKPARQRNEGRILVQGTHVEHWLNGAKVIDNELGSAALKAAKAKSKFKDVPGVGRQAQGPHPAPGPWRRGRVPEPPDSRPGRPYKLGCFWTADAGTSLVWR